MRGVASAFFSFMTLLFWFAATPPTLAQISGDMSLGVNLPGSDYTSFAVADANPASCAAACSADGQCTSWTFVKPGVQGAEAMCWLKNAIPAGEWADCCISGVVREASVPAGGGTYHPVPAINGVEIDWCPTYGANCGQAGADLFCATIGQGSASGWNWGYADRTWVIGSGQYCEMAGACGALRDVTCTGTGTVTNPGGVVAGGTISVLSATYGGNCGAPAGNVTSFLTSACNGLASCDYAVHYQTLGDPAYGCQKDFAVQWSCDGVPQHLSLPGEAGFGSVAALSCQPK